MPMMSLRNIIHAGCPQSAGGENPLENMGKLPSVVFYPAVFPVNFRPANGGNYPAC
jgi:hypothetical protein